MNVITGNATGVPAGGKVLRSTAEDKVFINFIDHGGVGIIAFPNTLLHVTELSQSLKTMREKNMFKELVFYMEACESGSMFPNLEADGKILAVTAANGKESSWGFYCGGQAKVNGKNIGSCLGDLFSIAWMEDSDLGNLATETIETQVQRVTKRTNKSHVCTFGDKSFEQEPIGSFETKVQTGAAPTATEEGSALDARDIPLHYAFYRWENAQDEHEKLLAYSELLKIVADRESDKELFQGITKKVCDGFVGCPEALMTEKNELKENDCHKKLVDIVHYHCPSRTDLSAGGWNDFNMQFSQVLANICERKSEFGKDVGDLETIVKDQCGQSSNDARGTRQKSELVV